MTSTGAATPARAPGANRTVDAFVEAACAGAGVPAGLFTPDVVLGGRWPAALLAEMAEASDAD